MTDTSDESQSVNDPAIQVRPNRARRLHFGLRTLLAVPVVIALSLVLLDRVMLLFFHTVFYHGGLPVVFHLVDVGSNRPIEGATVTLRGMAVTLSKCPNPTKTGSDGLFYWDGEFSALHSRHGLFSGPIYIPSSGNLRFRVEASGYRTIDTLASDFADGATHRKSDDSWGVFDFIVPMEKLPTVPGQ